MKKATLSLFIFFYISHICHSQIPAFPGAEGFGANTVGGRGGRVIKVTNLNDHGPGSLREAIELNEPRIIIFTVGGIINLETELSIRNPFLTIAGQTAPGDGICIRGECIRVYTHDVVIRHLRSRPGDIDFGPLNDWQHIDAISIWGSAYNVVIDHCSLSWAVDENIDVWQNAHDITIQNCIISEALNRSRHPKGHHGMGMIIGSRANNISVHHNIFAHNNDRNPHINGPSFIDFRNNVIYNPGGVATDIGAQKKQVVNYINNYILKGPRTKIPFDIIIRNIKAQPPKVYISGNIGINKEFRKGYYRENNNWSLFLNTEEDIALIKDIELPKAHPAPIVTTFTAEQALEYVLEEAGATLPKRDAVDREVIRDIINGGDGMVNRKNYLLAWPPFEAGIPLLDTDDDGMPDHWEERYGLNPWFNDNSEDIDGDGYTNIEEYLNNTNPTDKREDQTFSVNPLSNNVKKHTDFPQLKLNIEQNYPNPHDDYTNIKFSVDHPSNVVIKVISTDGKEVAELVNGFLYEGKYHIIWDSSNIDPGIYQILIASENNINSVKTVLSR